MPTPGGGAGAAATTTGAGGGGTSVKSTVKMSVLRMFRSADRPVTWPAANSLDGRRAAVPPGLGAVPSGSGPPSQSRISSPARSIPPLSSRNMPPPRKSKRSNSRTGPFPDGSGTVSFVCRSCRPQVATRFGDLAPGSAASNISTRPRPRTSIIVCFLAGGAGASPAGTTVLPAGGGSMAVSTMSAGTPDLPPSSRFRSRTATTGEPRRTVTVRRSLAKTSWWSSVPVASRPSAATDTNTSSPVACSRLMAMPSPAPVFSGAAGRSGLSAGGATLSANSTTSFRHMRLSWPPWADSRDTVTGFGTAEAAAGAASNVAVLAGKSNRNGPRVSITRRVESSSRRATPTASARPPTRPPAAAGRSAGAALGAAPDPGNPPPPADHRFICTFSDSSNTRTPEYPVAFPLPSSVAGLRYILSPSAVIVGGGSLTPRRKSATAVRSRRSSARAAAVSRGWAGWPTGRGRFRRSMTSTAAAVQTCGVSAAGFAPGASGAR